MRTNNSKQHPTPAPQPPPQAAPPTAINPQALYRLPKVQEFFPVSKATIYSWIAQGNFPAPVKLGPSTSCWRGADLLALLEGVKP